MKTTGFFLAVFLALLAGALFTSKHIGSYCLTGAVLWMFLFFVVRVMRN